MYCTSDTAEFILNEKLIETGFSLEQALIEFGKIKTVKRYNYYLEKDEEEAEFYKKQLKKDFILKIIKEEIFAFGKTFVTIQHLEFFQVIYHQIKPPKLQLSRSLVFDK